MKSTSGPVGQRGVDRVESVHGPRRRSVPPDCASLVDAAPASPDRTAQRRRRRSPPTESAARARKAHRRDRRLADSGLQQLSPARCRDRPRLRQRRRRRPTASRQPGRTDLTVGVHARQGVLAAVRDPQAVGGDGDAAGRRPTSAVSMVFPDCGSSSQSGSPSPSRTTLLLVDRDRARLAKPRGIHRGVGESGARDRVDLGHAQASRQPDRVVFDREPDAQAFRQLRGRP